jgi:hypothetical protein
MVQASGERMGDQHIKEGKVRGNVRRLVNAGIPIFEWDITRRMCLESQDHTEGQSMLRLLSLPLKDQPNIRKLRHQAQAAPSDRDAQVALASALARAGCSYEAAAILRPLRSHWKTSKSAKLAGEAIEAQAWWNKNWRAFVRLKQSGKKAAALAVLGDRATQYWDMPPLLIHLAEIAANEGKPDLANHLYHRVLYLTERGLPKMNMEAFRYVSQAALADLLLQKGDAAAALDHHLSITPNPGNAMAHEMQHAELLVATRDLDGAMQKAALILVTANTHRAGYGKTMRIDFIKSSPALKPLRKRADWTLLLKDPAAYLRNAKQKGK